VAAKTKTTINIYRSSEPRSARIPSARRSDVRDVAALAGVSVATVSRALSRPQLVSDEKLKSVRAAVRKLNYVVQGVGRALSSRQTRTIGAILPTIDHAMWAKTTYELQAALAKRGYTLSLACTEFDQDREIELARRFIELGADGIVLFGKTQKPELHALLEHLQIPYVSTWSYDPSPRGTAVGFDNRKAALLVVDHLALLGHERIGIIAGSMASEWQRERLVWLRHETERLKIPLREDWIVEGPFSFETGRNGVKRLMRQPDRPTAIICGHDIIAVGALGACREIGIQVPEEVSLTGFEDLDLASAVVPSLTTVHFPAGDLGALAGEQIMKRIDAAGEDTQIEVPIRLVVRGTTAKVRSTTERRFRQAKARTASA